MHIKDCRPNSNRCFHHPRSGTGRGAIIFPSSVCFFLVVLFGGWLYSPPAPAGTDAGCGWVNILDYLPDSWELDGSIDLQEDIQRALDENTMVFFPGSNDPDAPLIYPLTAGCLNSNDRTGLVIRAGAKVKFGPHSRLLRLPSFGVLITMEEGARLSGAVIDGNKYAHWPEFGAGEERFGGQTQSAIWVRYRNVVSDVVVFDNPGHAFTAWGPGYNKFYRCRAENIGYIDVKFGARFWQGDWGRWASDGFYLRGEGNLVRDCEAYDCFRWDYTLAHSGSRQNTVVDSRGGDVNFSTYGFIDVEDAEGNNRLVRCISPNSRIVVAVSAQTEVIQCMASWITAWDRAESIDRYAADAGMRNHGVVLDNNITTEGGIVIGGTWQGGTEREQLVPGGASLLITNNRMYKSNPFPTPGRSDWSFSVNAADGYGVVANNLLFEYQAGEVRGPGKKLYNITGHNNQVLYGQWQIDLPRPRLEYTQLDDAVLEKRQKERALQSLEKLLDASDRAGLKQINWLPVTAGFITDIEARGVDAGWAETAPVDEDGWIEQMSLLEHWDHQIGRHPSYGWYFLDFPLPSDPFDPDSLYLFFAAIDSEAEIFLNGHHVGRHEGWNQPSLHQVDSTFLNLQQESQRLAVKAYTPSGRGGIYGPAGLVILHHE